MNKLLACIDASLYATSVCDYAVWIAGQTGAAVEILHVIQRKDATAARNDLSGTVGLGAKSALLEELASIDEAEGKLAQEQGRRLLAAAQQHLASAEIASVTLTHRHGGIVETIIEREEQADLVIIGKRGASADFAKGHLGSKVERVVRQSKKPVFVASRAFNKPTAVIVAFDGGQSARKALEFAAASPFLAGLKLHVVMAGAEDPRNRDHLAWAEAQTAHIQDRSIKRFDGDAGQVIHDYQRQLAEQEQCLLLMGAYGHSPLRSMIIGSTTTEMIRSSKIPVLLFR